MERKDSFSRLGSWKVGEVGKEAISFIWGSCISVAAWVSRLRQSRVVMFAFLETPCSRLTHGQRTFALLSEDIR